MSKPAPEDPAAAASEMLRPGARALSGSHTVTLSVLARSASRSALFRSQRAGVALDDRRGRLHRIDGADPLTRVHGHRLDVAVDARKRQVDRIARDAGGDLLALARAAAGGRSPPRLPALIRTVAEHAMGRWPADVEQFRQHGVATLSLQQPRLVTRMSVALVAGHEARAHRD